MMMPHPCPSASRLLTSFRGIYVKVESLKFQQFYLMKFDFFQGFNFDLKFLWNWSFFYTEKIMRFKKVLNNLEAKGQGLGIIMGVTLLLLLWPFYYIALYCTVNVLSAKSTDECLRTKSQDN